MNIFGVINWVVNYLNNLLVGISQVVMVISEYEKNNSRRYSVT